MLVRLIAIAGAAVLLALLLALPAYAGQDCRSWSPQIALVEAGAGRLTYADARPVRSQRETFRDADRGSDDSWRIQRGQSKRFTPERGQHKFVGRHSRRKCPPGPSKAHFGRGHGKGSGYGPAKCQGHRYQAGKK